LPARAERRVLHVETWAELFELRALVQCSSVIWYDVDRTSLCLARCIVALVCEQPEIALVGVMAARIMRSADGQGNRRW